MAWTAEKDRMGSATGPLLGEGTALPGETEGVLMPQKGERNALDTSSEKNGEAKLCDVAAGWTDGAASEMGTEQAKGTGRRRRRREGANAAECVDGAPRRDGTPGTGRRRRRAQGEGDGQETPGAACGMAALDERSAPCHVEAAGGARRRRRAGPVMDEAEKGMERARAGDPDMEVNGAAYAARRRRRRGEGACERAPQETAGVCGDRTPERGTDAAHGGDAMHPGPEERSGKEKADREQLVLGHRSLVRAVIARAYPDMPHSLRRELVAYGMIGLCKAARDFDPARGIHFPTVAYPYIRNEAAHGVRLMFASIHIPHRRRADYARFLRGEALPLPGAELAALRAATTPAISDDLAAADPGFDRAELRADLMRALRALSPRQRFVVRERILRRRRLCDIAMRLGCSAENIRLIEREALSILRRRLRGYENFSRHSAKKT